MPVAIYPQVPESFVGNHKDILRDHKNMYSSIGNILAGDSLCILEAITDEGEFYSDLKLIGFNSQYTKNGKSWISNGVFEIPIKEYKVYVSDVIEKIEKEVDLDQQKIS